jgi:hypothetical protein
VCVCVCARTSSVLNGSQRGEGHEREGKMLQ